MTVSTTINSSMTALELITTAMENIGHIAIGDVPSADDGALGLKHLNWMLKTWQTSGVCDGWRLTDLSLTWPATTATATLNTNYLELTNVRYRDANSMDLPLTLLSAQEYADLPDKTSAGSPTSYNVRKTRDSLVLGLWPVSASIITIIADAARVVFDVTALTQTVDVPQEWTETVWTCLAARLLAPCRTHLSDPETAANVQQRAAELYAALKGFDEESGSIFLGLSR